MKIVKPLILSVMLGFMGPVFAEAPAPLPPEPTANDVASLENLNKYVKSLVDYLKSAPPYLDPDNPKINLNARYATRIEGAFHGTNISGAAVEHCTNGNCVYYAGITSKGFCAIQSLSVAMKYGPVEAGRSMVLSRLTKMYHYALDHHWPALDANSEEAYKKELPMLNEIQARYVFTGPTSSCATNNYNGCSLLVESFGSEYPFNSLPCANLNL